MSVYLLYLIPEIHIIRKLFFYLLAYELSKISISRLSYSKGWEIKTIKIK